MKAFQKLGFDISYLALLTKEHIKPLSRWESTSSRGQVKALHHLGLKTNTVERKLANGGAITELIFSTSSRYLDFYTRRFHQTPVKKDRQTVLTEGFLFGYPGCCVRNFTENGYGYNDFIGRDQEILFHWACPGCRATPDLLPYYRKTHQQCQQLFATRGPSIPDVLKKSLPAAALSLIFTLTSAKVRADDPHWLHLGAEDPNGDYLKYSEEVLLGVHECFRYGEDPNGPLEALKFSAIIDALPDTPSNNSCYVQYHIQLGIENCQICGQVMNMGFVSIHNPMRDMITYIPFMGLHYMQHGSFSYDGTENSGRVDIEQLKNILAHYDTDHYTIETANDADNDGLRDDYESHFGTQIDDPDSDDNQLEDGPQVAERLIEAIARLPVIDWGDTPPDDSLYVIYLLADGLETCDICGITINMGTIHIINPTSGSVIIFPLMGLHHLAHGRFAYGGGIHSGEIDALQLDTVLDISTSVPPGGWVPEKHELSLHNYPNPFNVGTEIEFSLPEAGGAILRIYNINGQLVRTLLDTHLEGGQHLAHWDARDDAGGRVASGVYFCRLEYAGSARAGKMLLLK